MNALITPVINRLRESQEGSDTGVVERAFEVAKFGSSFRRLGGAGSGAQRDQL